VRARERDAEILKCQCSSIFSTKVTIEGTFEEISHTQTHTHTHIHTHTHSLSHIPELRVLNHAALTSASSRNFLKKKSQCTGKFAIESHNSEYF
jgi:hypothetical protein